MVISPPTAGQRLWQAIPTPVVVVLGGATFALQTFIVISFGIFGAAIRDDLEVTEAVAGRFATAALLGTVVGVVIAGIRGDHVDRKHFVITRGLTAAALLGLLLLPLVDGVTQKLVIVFAATALIPFEPLIRALLAARLEMDARRLQANLTGIFMVGLFAYRFPFVQIAKGLENPWWGVAAAGFALAALVGAGIAWLPDDPIQAGTPTGWGSGLRGLWQEALLPWTAWATLLGATSGARQGVFDGTHSFSLTDHGFGEKVPLILGINAISWFGATALAAGIAAVAYGSFASKRPKLALIVAMAAMDAAYLLLIPTTGMEGGAWVWAFFLGATLAYIASNWALVVTITTASTTSTAVWVAGRVLGITAGVQLGAQVYDAFGYAGTVWLGLGFGVLEAVLLPFALRWLRDPYGDPRHIGKLRKRRNFALTVTAKGAFVRVAGELFPFDRSLLTIIRNGRTLGSVRDLPPQTGRRLLSALRSPRPDRSRSELERREVVEYAPGRFALIKWNRGVGVRRERTMDGAGWLTTMQVLAVRWSDATEFDWTLRLDASRPSRRPRELVEKLLEQVRRDEVRLRGGLIAAGILVAAALLAQSVTMAAVGTVIAAWAAVAAPAVVAQRQSTGEPPLPRYAVASWTIGGVIGAAAGVVVMGAIRAAAVDGSMAVVDAIVGLVIAAMLVATELHDIAALRRAWLTGRTARERVLLSLRDDRGFAFGEPPVVDVERANTPHAWQPILTMALRRGSREALERRLAQVAPELPPASIRIQGSNPFAGR